MPTRKSAKKDQPLRLEYVDPATLDDNPRNWRRHPERQKKALAAALDKAGWAGALLYNERTKRLIDGHARKEHAIEHKIAAVPVLIGRWTDKQEQLVLASLDPIGAMATTDKDALAGLVADLDDVAGDSEELVAFLAKLAPKDNTPADQSDDLPDGYQVVVTCKSETEQTELMEKLEKEGFECRALVLPGTSPSDEAAA